jgi:peptidoglycan/LPS O-acetylase OafA/YrhL
MNPVSIYPVICALILLIAIAFLFKKRRGILKETSGRFVSIDGLRGYLAFFVFLCHSVVWYFFLRTGKWEVPPSNLYTHLGESSVVLFFMITGFLFSTKLINGKNKKIDWSQLYVSRIMRLAPLYFFMLLLVVIITAVLSNFTLNEPVIKLAKEIVRWSTFTILGTPDLNGIKNTAHIVAGVTWSLPYEWLFYFSLPILAIFIRIIPPYRYLLFSIIFIAAMFWGRHLNLYHLASFCGGITAAFFVRWKNLTDSVNGKTGAFLVLMSLATTINFFNTAYCLPALFLLTIVFTIIASGNTLLGILGHSISLFLGEMAYSIYLLHGIVLFVTFKFIIGFQYAASLSAIEHWFVIMGCTVFLIPICFTTFYFIEAPGMRSTSKITEWLHTL